MSLGRLHLARRHYQLLAAFLTNPNLLADRAVGWLATIQMVNNRSNFYAAINLVNYILTQAVCELKYYRFLFFPLLFLHLSPQKM